MIEIATCGVGQAITLDQCVNGVVTNEDVDYYVVEAKKGDRISAEVVAAVEGRVPVMIDSGFRRGTDIFKALALGADAVCIGRAYIWGLAAFGQPGVEKVLDMLNAELRMVMGQMGASAVDEIGLQHIGVRG